MMMRIGMASWLSFVKFMVVALACMLMMMMDGSVLTKVAVSAEGTSPSQCMEEKRMGLNACKSLAFGQPPSAACCQRIRVQHWECICPAITPKLAAVVDVNRAILIFQTCGRRVPRHFKCGSLRFP